MSFVEDRGASGLAGGAVPATAGGLASLGSIAGMAGQLGALTGMPGAGLLGGAASAVQLAQTGMAMLGKTPESIADALNSVTGGRPQLTQDNRYVTLDTPLGQDVLLVNAAVIDEHVNQLPEIHLDLLSHRNNIGPEQIVGQRVKIALDPQGKTFSLTKIVAASAETDERRYFDGYVASFGRVGNSGTVTRYEMSVVPWFWFLTRSTDCRIFQNLAPQDILREIFQEMGFADFEFDIRSERPPLEYIVMYDESYYHFCTRLMEQEGLVWTFRFEKDRHVLVIGDSNSLFRPIPNLETIPYYADSAASELNGIDRWDEAFSFRVGKITFRDFNYNQPSSSLMHVEVPTVSLKHDNIQGTERYQYHSLYDHGEDGERYARYAMEAEEAQARRFNGAGYARGMTTNGRFTLVNHASSSYNDKEFVILRVRHQAVNDYTRQGAELPYHNTFTCLPFDIPFRPERRTRKPSMHGTQSAMVVGPKGEEIHTDGSRVKLHFPWDRRGKRDGSDSMWVRVSQPWAGKGWGGAAIPRIGQEVIVAFNEGDPDNPVVVGRVFNGDSGNPYHGSGGQTMGIKSQTHKGAGSNELRFSDANGAQEFFMHAQKDMNTVVKDNESHTVEGGARKVSVLKGDETKHVAQGSLTETIALTRSSTANVINTQAVANAAGPGTQSHEASDGIEHRVGDSVVTMTKGSIKLTHGASTILIDASGIYIDGPVIHLNQGGASAPPGGTGAAGGDAAAAAGAAGAGAGAGAGAAGAAAAPQQTGLGDDVDKLAAKSPGLQGDLKKLKDDGWKFKYGAPGGGSFANRGEQTVTLDGNLKGNTAATTQALAHEAGHATYPFKPDYSSKAAYVDGTLADEGAATLNNIKAQREILANGGQDIGIAGNSANHAAYNKAYDQFLKDGNADAARHAIGAQFGKGEITSTTKQPYAEYYGGWYDKNFPPKK
ncbi:type VI secretion system tip protein VgrG [Burkholderia stagnalis]|uniref:type VI secretion system Vgr family protein n=2 Tax=Burkholderia stagnalis TaxID=1503054 RepID=UPI000F599AF5|nr:type VI secretion system Vgr family protein [Burkholderia stagnalis]RQQ04651.1 type VI secretion system tip protein VgrG [Burkholderia stagnalis]RQQ13154.1 type VI secretion system tip protein VgrG [Burkholderia stagnalis]RQQ31365.1 type VI secretion system tip protein VgrG [Burkholderia stagnalis]RQQ91540.1 type VI secretion system tip protein VgrG [Burkholderia stagnalis]RQX85249.1 type VI secretion system tip protein VgrG [Burkholderia stagnalis]